MQGTLIKLQ